MTSCFASAGQECLGPLTSFEVERTYDPITGYTHTTGGVTREFHKITLDYFDNRETIDTTFHTYGEFTLENLAPESARYIKYRRTVDLPYGYYDIERISFPSHGIQLCADTNEFVMSKSGIHGGFYSASFDYPFEYMAHRMPVGDVNNDGCINGGDLGLIIALWGTDDVVMDLNSDGIVDGGDIGLVVASFSPPGCVPDNGGGGDEEENDYNSIWESADDIIAMEITSLPKSTGDDWILLDKQINVLSYKGTLDLIEDTGSAGPAVFVDLGAWQAMGVSDWATDDTWIVEVWRDDVIIATTSTDSPVNPNQQINAPDGSSNYGNSIYWQYLVPWHDLVIGDTWVVYRWFEYPNDVVEYPPDRFYNP